MSRFVKMARTFYSVLFAGGVLWVGLLVGPGNAGADVFMLVERARQTLGSLDPQPHPGGTRTITFNGVPLRADLYLVDEAPAEVIRRIATEYSDEHLAEMSDGDPFAKLDAAIEEASRPFSDDELVMQEVSSMLGLRTEASDLVDEGVQGLINTIEKPFFSVGEGWAMYGRFPASTWTGSANGGESGWNRHSYRGLGFVTLAVQDQVSADTFLWRLEFPEGFSWGQIANTSTGDAPGVDVDGLSRYPGSRRLGSVGESAAFGRFQTATYIGPGSVQEHVAWFRRMFARDGSTTAPYEPIRDGSAMLVASKDGLQFSVFVTASADGREVVDVLQRRGGA